MRNENIIKTEIRIENCGIRAPWGSINCRKRAVKKIIALGLLTVTP
jgi:hypothetical protein